MTKKTDDKHELISNGKNRVDSETKYLMVPIPKSNELEKPFVINADGTVQPELFPEEVKTSLLASISRSSFYRGPLPPPEELAKYNAAVPNAAERILDQFEKQGNHRRTMESVVESNMLEVTKRAQNFGLVIVLTVIIVAAILALVGNLKIEFVYVIGGALASLLGVYMWGNRPVKEDKIRKISLPVSSADGQKKI